MRPTSRPDGEAAVLAKIAAMPAPYCAMGERRDALILRSAPALQPTVWYGMPGYAKDGKTVCFFRADKKYMTFGLTQDANLTREEGAPHQLIESAWYFTALDQRRLSGQFPITSSKLAWRRPRVTLCVPFQRRRELCGGVEPISVAVILDLGPRLPGPRRVDGSTWQRRLEPAAA